MKKLNVRAALLIAAAFAAVASAEEPTTAPTRVDATDAAAVKAAMGTEVLVEGVCSNSSWSKTGSVMFVNFKGVERGGFSAVAFAKLKDRLDKAFMGDAAKDFTGAKLRIRGKITEHNGVPQVVISDPSQVTIVEAASGGATTQP